jgi:hypothetical protein
MFPSINNLLCLFDQQKNGITPYGHYPSINDLLCFLISQKRNLSHPEAENEAHFWPDFVQILPFS